MTAPHTDPVPDLRRLWDAVPGGHPQVAAMVAAGRRRRRRGRAAVAGLAAAAVVATGGGVWAATTGGRPPGRDAGQVATDPTATTEVTVYYTNDPGADVGGGGFVIPQLVPRVLEVADTGDPAYDALHALLTMPPAQPQLLTGFNGFHDVTDPAAAEATIDVASVTVDEGVITVDLTRDPWIPYVMRDMDLGVSPGLAVQQVVYTAQDALDTDVPVALTFGGEPVRGVWARRFDWPVAADPDVLPAGAAQDAPRVVDLPTSSWQYGNPARLALSGGTLWVDENGCPFFGGAEGPRTYPIWPQGYSATLAPDGRLEVRRADGLLVAVDGDRLTAGGGSATAESRTGCIPADADEVWLVEEELPPRTTR
ncbi:GerMN domain-containing protein [Nocardioides ferulae]|uniref:GerMN domain-containing protein n=1 Tax=Nocardioides ferulae TaxID=2340821 RepID=UPI000EB37631|nr:GerMN domain-containing protein [Nocardioides ferulae]